MAHPPAASILCERYLACVLVNAAIAHLFMTMDYDVRGGLGFWRKKLSGDSLFVIDR